MRRAESNSEHYRKTAAILRLLAQQVRTPDSRARLLALAESFERLADRAETWAPAGDREEDD